MTKTHTKTAGNYRRRTRYQGVYERESGVRSFRGRPDICFDITYKRDGKKMWEKAGWLSEGYSAKLAADVRADRVRSIHHGEELPRKNKKVITFKDLAMRYLKWARENKSDRGEHDHGRYENHLEALGEKRLDEISSFDLERLKNELTKSGLAPATVKHCLVLIRQMFNKATAWGLYKGANPIKGVKLPTLQNQRERFLSYAEADTLLTALKERSLDCHDMAMISLYCGLRAGEIFNLRANDLDFRNDIITVFEAKAGTRKAFMPETLKAMLKGRTTEAPDGFIFSQATSGDRYREVPKGYREIADKLFNKGIKEPRQRVTFHTLRHSFASWLALQGESLVTIRELLGHRSFAMTQRYAHLIPDERRRATVKLEKAFMEGKTKADNIHEPTTSEEKK